MTQLGDVVRVKPDTGTLSGLEAWLEVTVTFASAAFVRDVGGEGQVFEGEVRSRRKLERWCKEEHEHDPRCFRPTWSAIGVGEVVRFGPGQIVPRPLGGWK